MRRLIVIAAVSAAWIAAHVAYFGYYNRLLALPFTAVSAAFTGLWSAWIFTLLFFFRSRIMRAVVGLAYVFFLGWAVVNFAYYQVFHNFLTLSFRKIAGLNAAMVELLADFQFLVPAPMALVSAGLLIAFAIVAGVIGTAPRSRKLRVVLCPGGATEVPGRRRTGHRIAAVGLLAQVLFVSLAHTSVAAYRGEIAAKGLPADKALADLGVFGFAVAAWQGSRDLQRTRPAEPAPPGTGAILEPSKTNLEALRAAMADLSGAGAAPAWPIPRQPPNIIVYQMESVALWPLALRPSAMPFLDALMRRRGAVGSYLANGCTTIDAELAVNCGFLPDTFGPVSDLYAKNEYRCLPTLLKERGYSTAMYHANDPTFWNRDSLAPAWGFERLAFKPEFLFREPDSRIFDRVVDDIKAAKNSAAAGQPATAGKPGYYYVVGMTSHSPHNKHFQDHYKKRYGLEIEPYAGDLGEAGRSAAVDWPTLRLYLGFMKAGDDGLKHLFERLAEERLLDDTIVVGFSDHRYYDLALPDPLRQFVDYNRLPFFIHVPGIERPPLPAVASHIDVAPTLYELAGGDPEAMPPSFLGRSMLRPAAHPVAITKCLGRTSLFDGDLIIEHDAVLGSSRALSSTAREPAVQSRLIEALRSIGFMSDLALRRNELGGSRRGLIQPASRTIRFDNVTDSDGDGISDLREAGIGSDPGQADSDDDGFKDGLEVLNGFNPRGPGKWVRPRVNDGAMLD